MTKTVLLLPTFLICLCSWAYDITGIVSNPEGAPVEAASVWLWQETGVQTLQTDAAGAYAFRNLPSGPTRVIARREGLALAGAEFQLLGDTDTPLQLGEAASVSLRIVDHEYKPVPGASVKGLNISDSYGVPIWELAEQGFPSRRADADGIVTLPDLPKGGHIGLVLYHPDYAETRVPYLPVSDKRQTFQLFPGTPIQGRVTAPDGKGLPRARVCVYRLTAGGRRDFAERFTDPEGFYGVAVPPGEYLLDARHPDYASPLSVSFTVGVDALTADVALLEPSRLAGRIFGPQQKPMSGVALRYVIDDRFHSERFSRRDGSYELVIPPGKGILRVLPPRGYITTQANDIPVRLDRAMQVDMDPIHVKALPVIEGAVMSIDGTPQPQVLIGTRNVTPAFWLLTDDQGRFRIEMADPPEDGKASFRAEHGLRFLRKDFEVDLRKHSGQVEVILEEFEPDLSRDAFNPGDEEAVDPSQLDLNRNDLSGLLDLKAPELAVDHWFNSDTLTLDGLKGKVVVLTLWAGFDEIGPSRDRMYEMCALDALLSGLDDVTFLGIHDNGSDPEEIEQFIRNYGIRFPVARDVEAFTTFDRYSTRVIPQTVLIDKQGRVRYTEVDSRLLELIKSLRRDQ